MFLPGSASSRSLSKRSRLGYTAFNSKAHKMPAISKQQLLCSQVVSKTSHQQEALKSDPFGEDKKGDTDENQNIRSSRGVAE